jgi:hypothetical protein
MNLSSTTRILTACVLLTAAGLKGYQLSTEPSPDLGLLSNRWLLTLGLQIEIILGAWLLSGAARRWSWRAAGAMFAVFSAITLYKGLAGQSSCGCFGRVEISPWYTLVLDLGILAALIGFRATPETPARQPARLKLRVSIAALLAAVCCITAGVSIAAYRPATLSDDGMIVGDDRFVVLEPDKWLGKTLPLLGHIDAADKLVKGAWTLVLYHHDCPHCREALPKIEKLAASYSSSRTERFALVEMPPYAPDDSLRAARGCTIAKLSNKRDWFAVTPTLISLKDGKVSAVVEGDITNAPAPKAERAVPAAASRPAATDNSGDTLTISISGDKASHDFRYVKPKAKRSVIFAIPNKSGAPLKITKVRSECKCMLAPDPPKELVAKGATPIRIDFIAPDKPMRYSKRILVQTNDPDRAMIVLRIEADVARPIYAEPKVLDLGEIPAGTEIKTPITLINHSDKPVRLAYGTSTSPQCVARVPRGAIKPGGGKLSLPIVVNADRAGVTGKATVRIHTDCPTQQQVSVQVKYAVAPPAAAMRNLQDKQRARDTENK